MPKLIEVSIWNRLLNLFSNAKESGKETKLYQQLKKYDPEVADIYKDWTVKNNAVLMATKRALEKRNMDTKAVDDLIKKYG